MCGDFGQTNTPLRRYLCTVYCIQVLYACQTLHKLYLLSQMTWFHTRYSLTSSKIASKLWNKRFNNQYPNILLANFFLSDIQVPRSACTYSCLNNRSATGILWSFSDNIRDLILVMFSPYEIKHTYAKRNWWHSLSFSIFDIHPISSH